MYDIILTKPSERKHEGKAVMNFAHVSQIIPLVMRDFETFKAILLTKYGIVIYYKLDALSYPFINILTINFMLLIRDKL